MASGAQALSQGAVEQASSIEELAATIGEILEHVQKTAGNAADARDRSTGSGEETTVCSHQMNDMIEAMDEIGKKSAEIGKIIKTIEDIAFQTNILALNAAVEAASVGGVLYAYPLTADNGYFLYYNKEYFSEEDVKSLDQMLEVAAQAEKLVAMDWSSAGYVYAFFGNTGLEVGLNEDGLTNYCTWNSTDGAIRGTDVGQAMLSIAKSPAFASLTDTEILSGIQDGTVIAGVSGVWNAVAIEEAWGENAGAAKLPVYTCAGQQVQMASFSGCKLIGVNAYSEHPEWAARLAEWITNEENQSLRFRLRGQGPANINAAHSPEVQASSAIAALLAQSEFSQLQRVGGKFWDPVAEFAGSMADGNPSGVPIQTQLDRMVEGVTAR